MGDNQPRNNPDVSEPTTERLKKGDGSRETANAQDETKRSVSLEPKLDNAGKQQDAFGISKYDHGWRRIVRNFSPSWSSVTMGTGIVAILFISIPYHAPWLNYISYVFFALNALLFLVVFLISLLRYSLYPEIWRVMIQDPVHSLFLGTIPMGFATLVEMWLLACVPVWGGWAVWVSWIAWMIDAVAAALVTVFLCFTHISRSEQTDLREITATQLLPIAATIVAAGTGSEVAETLVRDRPQYALGTVVTSFVMWGMGTPLAMTVLVMYYQRLAVHKLPPREVLVSCFLPLGPLGFGGYTVIYLGKVSKDLLPITHMLHPLAGDVLYIQGFLVALVLWGFGLIWLVLALAAMWKCRPIPFNMGWWGFTFPLGVFAASTIQIGLEMPSETFKILGTIFSVAVILLWFVVAARTAEGAWNGKLFYAPCLAQLTRAEVDKGRIGLSHKAA